LFDRQAIKKTLRILGGHKAGSSGGDPLAIDTVLHIPGGKNAFRGNMLPNKDKDDLTHSPGFSLG